MKAFNIKEYLKNPSRKVVTREGRSVRVLCVDKKGGEFPIIALIQQCTRDNEIIGTFTKDGKWSTTIAEQPNDLFFAPEKHEGWINIFRGKDNPFTGNIIFASKEEAEESGRHCCGFTKDLYITSGKVEWEE